MSKQNYVIEQGDDFVINLAFTDSAGAAIDITGYTILFTAKTSKSLADSDSSVIKVAGAIVSAIAGTATVTLSAASLSTITGTYYYKIEYIASGIVKTFQTGVITIKKTVSTRAS